MPKKRHVQRHPVTQPLDTDYRFIPLTQGQNAIVDAADFEWLNQWNWFAMWAHGTKSFCAARRDGKKTYLPMHGEILKCAPGLVPDHINHDTLDNRRSNLRPASPVQNRRNTRRVSNNTSGYIGVSWFPLYQKWVARIGINRKRICLGYFTSIADAVKARDEAAKNLHGEFAYLNHPT